MRANVLELDRPLAELEERIAEVKRRTAEEGVDRSAEIAALETTYKKLMKDIYSNLTPWEKTLLARHPKRPYTLDYVASMTEDFLEMHGDRTFGDDAAIIAGM